MIHLDHFSFNLLGNYDVFNLIVLCGLPISPLSGGVKESNRPKNVTLFLFIPTYLPTYLPTCYLTYLTFTLPTLLLSSPVIQHCNSVARTTGVRTRASSKVTLKVKKPLTERYKKSLAYLGPTKWNALPEHLQKTFPKNVFKFQTQKWIENEARTVNAALAVGDEEIE